MSYEGFPLSAHLETVRVPGVLTWTVNLSRRALAFPVSWRHWRADGLEGSGCLRSGDSRRCSAVSAADRLMVSVAAYEPALLGQPPMPNPSGGPVRPRGPLPHCPSVMTFRYPAIRRADYRASVRHADRVAWHFGQSQMTCSCPSHAIFGAQTISVHLVV